MCDCKKNIEARLLEMFAEQNQGDDHRIELGGYGLVIKGNAMKEKGCMPIEGSYLHTLKNGNTKRKKVSQSMFFNYCPFCGEQYT